MPARGARVRITSAAVVKGVCVASAWTIGGDKTRAGSKTIGVMGYYELVIDRPHDRK
jgi:hypothetical protein